MDIAAIIPYTGSEKLVKMTEDCINGLFATILPMHASMRILAVNNAASRELDRTRFPSAYAHEVMELVLDQNYGFGVGVNKALDYLRYGESMKFDAFLIVNNDLKFDDPQWLVKLLEDYEDRYVASPRTDVTATVEACHPGPADKPPQRLREVSAFCWLVPWRMHAAIESRFGFPLFCPQFSNYGSDDAAAAVLRKIYGETPFKLVHRSWVRHLKAQTANELGVRAGTIELLKELKTWKSKNKLR